MSALNFNDLREFANTTLPRLMEKSQATGGSVLLVHDETLIVHAAHGLKDERSSDARLPVGVGGDGAGGPVRGRTMGSGCDEAGQLH